jgi:uncharacterized protein YjhX (UPF0386 family)
MNVIPENYMAGGTPVDLNRKLKTKGLAGSQRGRQIIILRQKLHALIPNRNLNLNRK